MARPHTRRRDCAATPETGAGTIVPLWTEAQLVTLLSVFDASDRAVARQLDRPTRAVADLRGAIHAFHRPGAEWRGGDALSARLCRCLGARRGRLLCHRCGQSF